MSSKIRTVGESLRGTVQRGAERGPVRLACRPGAAGEGWLSGRYGLTPRV